MYSLSPRCVNFGYACMTAPDAALLLRNALALATGRRDIANSRWRTATEELFTSLTGAARSYAFPTARSGLLALLEAMGIGTGDEVLLTGFTCAAVPAPVVHRGARPVYVDIDLSSLNMDVAKLAAGVSPRTKAIIVQHTYGNPVDMRAVDRIAKQHGLYVIEDCALALGSVYDGRPVGSHGHAAVVSFEFSKTVTAGWGGIAWVNDAALVERMNRIHAARTRMLPARTAALRSFQVALSYVLYHPNFFVAGHFISEALYRSGIFRTSARPDEAQGRMPRDYFDQLSDTHWQVIFGQLQRVDHMAARSRSVAARYEGVLAARGLQQTAPEVLPSATPAWSRFPILVADRDDLRRHFRQRLLSLGQWFGDPVAGASDPTIFGYTAGSCPAGEFASRHVVNLPVSVRLTTRDEARVADALADYLDHHPKAKEFAESLGRVTGTAPEPAGVS